MHGGLSTPLTGARLRSYLGFAAAHGISALDVIEIGQHHQERLLPWRLADRDGRRVDLRH
jgi:hypothetical protein